MQHNWRADWPKTWLDFWADEPSDIHRTIMLLAKDAEPPISANNVGCQYDGSLQQQKKHTARHWQRLGQDLASCNLYMLTRCLLLLAIITLLATDKAHEKRLVSAWHDQRSWQCWSNLAASTLYVAQTTSDRPADADLCQKPR